MLSVYLEYRSKYYNIAKRNYAVFLVTQKYLSRYVLGVFTFDYQFFVVVAQNKSTSCPLTKGRTVGGYIRTAASNLHVDGYTFRNLPPQRKKINMRL